MKMMNDRLYKSNQNKIIDGVCAGIAEYFGIDSLIMRLAFVALILGWGSGLLLYLLLWVLAPKKGIL